MIPRSAALLAVVLIPAACASSSAPGAQGASEVQIPAASAAPRASSAWTAVPASPRPAPRAAATSEQDEQGAQELFQLGRQAMAAGNLVEACGLFARSNDLSPALGSLLNLADCEEKSGQIPEACQHWLEAAERARASNQGARSQVASDHARKLQCPGSGALGPPTRGPSRPFP